MASVYILYSETINKFYTGSCKDLQERLLQHINHSFTDSYTRITNDWVLFYAIENLEYKQARHIETHIKKMRTQKYYHDLTKYPEISAKLIEKYK